MGHLARTTDFTYLYGIPVVWVLANLVFWYFSMTAVFYSPDPSDLMYSVSKGPAAHAYLDYCDITATLYDLLLTDF